MEETFHQLESGYTHMIRDMFTHGFGPVASVGSCALVVVITNNPNGDNSKCQHSYEN